MDRKILVLIPGRDRRFLFSPKLPNRLWGTLAFSKMGIGDLYPRVTRLNLERNHSYPYTSNTEVQNEWSYALFPPVCFYVIPGTALLC
jgi:hypothetical protein